MSITDPLWGWSVLALSLPFVFLRLDLTNCTRLCCGYSWCWFSILWAKYSPWMHVCSSHWLQSSVYFIYSVFLPDAHRFSVTVLPKQCLLLISCGLNKLKMRQILFMFSCTTQHLSLAVNMWKLDTCFSMPEVFMSHPCSYNLFNLCKVWLH